MILITTKSGSIYRLDTDRKMIVRVPAAGGSVLRHDTQEHHYLAIVNGPTIGESFIYTHDLTTRFTTPVTRIETR